MSSFARTTHHLADQFKDTTSSAQAHAVEYALERLGLQRRQSALRPAMFFAAGAVVAGGLAIYFAPTLGQKLRAQILDLLGAAKEGEKMLEKRIDSVLSDGKAVTSANTNAATATATDRDRPRVVPPQNHS